MGWEMETTSQPVARKDYPCQAAHWIDNAGYTEGDYEPEDWAVIEKAEAEGWKILKGTQYTKTEGKWEGEFDVYRARLDLDAICNKYEIYQDV